MIRILIAATLCLTTLAQDLTSQRRRRDAKPPEMKHFTTEVVRFESESIGGESTYRVFLPMGYGDKQSAETLYPLVIWLHGMWEDHDRFYTRGGAEALDALRGDGEFPEAVFVCANGGRTSFYINGQAKDAKFEDLIANDLVAHLDATYRILEDHSSRAISGVSMGGYGALKIALKRPESFGIVAAHSAAILPRDPGELEQRFPWIKRWGGADKAVESIFGKDITNDEWLAENLLHIADQVEPDTLDGLKIYIDCGDADSYQFFAPNEELHQLFEQRKIKHTWRAVEGGGHGWRSNYNQAAIPESLRFVAAGFTVKRAAAGLGGLFGAKPDGEGKETEAKKR